MTMQVQTSGNVSFPRQFELLAQLDLSGDRSSRQTLQFTRIQPLASRAMKSGGQMGPCFRMLRLASLKDSHPRIVRPFDARISRCIDSRIGVRVCSDPLTYARQSATAGTGLA
jgi:hypothetical protein